MHNISKEKKILKVKKKHVKGKSNTISKRKVMNENKSFEYIFQSDPLNNNIIEAFTYPVYVIDVLTEKIIISNSAAKVSGINEGTIYEQINYGSLKTGSTSEGRPLKIVKKTKKPVELEYTLISEDGNNIYREVYGYPIFDLKGKVVQMVEYIMDVTERQHAQEELVKLSQAVEQSFNIVMIADKNGIIEYVNPKFTEVTGYTFEEIKGNNVAFLGQMTEEDEKCLWDALKLDGQWHGEFYNRKKNGDFYWEYSSIYSIRNSLGNVTHYIKDAVNISKRRQAEEELKAAKEKAELANRFKSQFIANMSHEIRTPLNSIMGFIELLLLTDLNKTQKDYFETIKDSSKVLLGIIDDILDFSKIESGKLDIDNIKFFLKHELEPVVDMFSARADEKNIELAYFIDPSLPEFVFGDPLRIKQVLNNLISNAVKFTNEYGSIIVEIKMAELTDNVCRIMFSVSDNGIGIPEDKKKAIFKAFFQADSTISRKYGGTGLGLAISSQLVKLMGGELMLDSKPGAGSRFFFELRFTEFSGVDIFKRDYNFEDVKTFLYSKDGDAEHPLFNIEKYLKAFNIETETFASVYDINISGSEIKHIVFIDYSSNAGEEMVNLLRSLQHVPIVLIASRMDKDFVSPLSDRIAKVIYKPVYASKIIAAIIDIVYNAEHLPNTEKHDEDFRITPFSAKALVAEDNAVNQKLVKIMLKEIGVDADIANNGAEVVESFKKKKYDIVLMDVNMPVVDGIEATERILKFEKLNELEHTPIVALTAKTIRGDREIILDSGMDDYLSKPISIKKLYGTLYPFLKDTQKEMNKNMTITRMASDSSSAEYSIDLTANELGVSVEFLKSLIEQYIKNFDSYMNNISGSIQSMDYEKIRFEAHKLKGTAANLRFNNLAACFFRMETNAKEKNNINYDELLEMANYEFNLLKKNLSCLQ